jgi:hypothetical protein
MIEVIAWAPVSCSWSTKLASAGKRSGGASKKTDERRRVEKHDIARLQGYAQSSRPF